ncbi:MAG: bifunctional folylpolyglutamate synthase/dihydrofolate synthase [Deltaproteobacteria bacterium]|nr:bifunctional folylpolyglutamate synthase/dihydrofolate synthase [Deltaproteobacteria bacterium]
MGGDRDPLEGLIDELLTRAGAGAKLGLERVAEALHAVGDPQTGLAVVHVAGTNGKGSCCAMVEAVARRAGLRTGLFTSPHLRRFNERIRIDGAPIDDQRFAAALTRALCDDLPRLSFFEALTVAALLAMRDAAIDLAILEVGLGGRLDATNVIDRPLVTAITSIGHDHEHFLGNDIADIAWEKASIFKRDVPAIIGPISGRAAARIAAVGRDKGCRAPIWHVVTEDEGHRAEVAELGHAPVTVTANGDGAWRLAAPDGRTTVAHPSLAGPHQVHNAAVAASVAWLAADHFPALAGHLPEGLAATRWPGRLERLAAQGKSVLLDCAHNEQAVIALCEALGPADPERTLLVFGTMDGKPWRPMLERLAPHAGRRIYCEPMVEMAGRAPAPPTELCKVAPGEVAPDPEGAIAKALREAGPDDTILVTGSIFLVGTVRAVLRGQARDVIVPL